LRPKKIEKTARVLHADCRIFPAMARDLMPERGWRAVADFMIERLERKIR
jgi:3D (Asp-Asp-Asp) domain-containing protein